MSARSAAKSSQTTAGMKRVNSGATGSENMIVLKASARGEMWYVTRFFYNSAVRPKEMNTLMARKFKNVTAIFPERVETKVFGQGTRFSLV